MKGLQIRNASDLDKAEKKLKEMRARAKGFLDRTRDGEARKHLSEMIGAIDRNLQEASKARRPAKADFVPGSPASNCLAMALMVMEQIGKDGYLPAEKKKSYRDVTAALRQQIQSLRNGFPDSNDEQSLDTAQQVVAMIEEKL